MNQFLVPQFIDVEPKIIGPLGLRQFVIVIVGIVLAVFCYKFADISLFVLELIVIVSLVILFGFIKINGQPFHYFLLNVFRVFVGSNIRVWKKEPTIYKSVETTEEKVETDVHEKEALKSSKLSELSLLLDTGGAYKGESTENKDKKTEENIKNNK